MLCFLIVKKKDIHFIGNWKQLFFKIFFSIPMLVHCLKDFCFCFGFLLIFFPLEGGGDILCEILKFGKLPSCWFLSGIMYFWYIRPQITMLKRFKFVGFLTMSAISKENFYFFWTYKLEQLNFRTFWIFVKLCFLQILIWLKTWFSWNYFVVVISMRFEINTKEKQCGCSRFFRTYLWLGYEHGFGGEKVKET